MLSFSTNPLSVSSAREILTAALALGLVVWGPLAARAEGPTPSSTDEDAREGARADAAGDLGWSYLIDGGVIPFAYGTGAAYAGLILFASPRETPLGFSASEGGAADIHETVPTYMIYGLAGATLFGMAVPRTPGRWHHLKGLVQSAATTALLTEVAKLSFGRHRPYYDPATSTADRDRKSFFSGHASMTLALTTYAGLYFHEHVFAEWRGPHRRFAWWETFPLAALAGLAVYVPYTRVSDNQHYLSDVLTGAAVGAATSVAFFAWQERRFRRSRAARNGPASERRATEAVIAPTIGHPGVSLLVSF